MYLTVEDKVIWDKGVKTLKVTEKQFITERKYTQVSHYKIGKKMTTTAKGAYFQNNIVDADCGELQVVKGPMDSIH